MMLTSKGKSFRLVVGFLVAEQRAQVVGRSFTETERSSAETKNRYNVIQVINSAPFCLYIPASQPIACEHWIWRNRSQALIEEPSSRDLEFSDRKFQRWW
jgi:hypothetical protein